MYIDKTRTNFFEEINQKYLISKKHKSVWMVLYYINQSFILVSVIFLYVLIYDFAFLVGIPICTGSSSVEL